MRRALSLRFAANVWQEARSLIGASSSRWNGVAEIYRTLLRAGTVAEDESFVDLGGDSLTYVEAAVALEQYLGHLPQDWPRRSVADLERERVDAAPL
jgi:hypothetical protein